MRKIILIAILFVASNCSVRAQDSTARFGLGYSLGTNGGVFASWMTGCCRIEPQIGFTYNTSNYYGQFASTSISKSATIGLGLAWVCNIEKNLNILFGPRLLLTASEYNTTEIDNYIKPPDTTRYNYKYLTTAVQIFIGPEYLLGKHFTVAAAFAPTASFRGKPTYDPPSYPSPQGTSLSFIIGGLLAARYYF